MNTSVKKPNLMEILSELTNYCATYTDKEIKLKLTLPKEVIEKFSGTCKPKERIKLFESTNTIEADPLLTAIWTWGGKVELFAEEETQVKKIKKIKKIGKNELRRT